MTEKQHVHSSACDSNFKYYELEDGAFPFKCVCSVDSCTAPVSEICICWSCLTEVCKNHTNDHWTVEGHCGFVRIVDYSVFCCAGKAIDLPNMRLGRLLVQIRISVVKVQEKQLIEVMEKWAGMESAPILDAFDCMASMEEPPVQLPPLDERKILPELSIDAIVTGIRKKLYKNIVVLVGHGVSFAAGAPNLKTFLENFSKHYEFTEPEVLTHLKYFRNDPKPFYEMVKELWPGNYQPTPAHFFVRMLQEHKVLLRAYTENRDSLEEAAGVRKENVVETCGSFLATPRCSDNSCGNVNIDIKTLMEAVHANEVLTCKHCGSPIRPGVYFDDERLSTRFNAIHKTDMAKADLLIIMESSLEKAPFDSLVDEVSAKCPRLLISQDTVMVMPNQLRTAYPDHSLGFLFGYSDNYRDVHARGDIQVVVQNIADDIGWNLRCSNEDTATGSPKTVPQQREPSLHQKPAVASKRPVAKMDMSRMMAPTVSSTLKSDDGVAMARVRRRKTKDLEILNENTQGSIISTKVADTIFSINEKDDPVLSPRKTQLLLMPPSNDNVKRSPKRKAHQANTVVLPSLSDGLDQVQSSPPKKAKSPSGTHQSDKIRKDSEFGDPNVLNSKSTPTSALDSSIENWNVGVTWQSAGLTTDNGLSMTCLPTSSAPIVHGHKPLHRRISRDLNNHVHTTLADTETIDNLIERATAAGYHKKKARFLTSQGECVICGDTVDLMTCLRCLNELCEAHAIDHTEEYDHCLLVSHIDHTVRCSHTTDDNDNETAAVRVAAWPTVNMKLAEVGGLAKRIIDGVRFRSEKRNTKHNVVFHHYSELQDNVDPALIRRVEMGGIPSIPMPPLYDRSRLCNLTITGAIEALRMRQFKSIVVMLGPDASSDCSGNIADPSRLPKAMASHLQSMGIPSPDALMDSNFFRQFPEAFYTYAHEFYTKPRKIGFVHLFLLALHERGLLRRVYTETIDGIVEASGLPRDHIRLVNGSLDEPYCENPQCRPEVNPLHVHNSLIAGHAPLCIRCRQPVRPGCVLTGDPVSKEFTKTQKEDMAAADLLLILGSSLREQPFASLISFVAEVVPRVLINHSRVRQMPLEARTIDPKSQSGFLFGHHDNYRDIIALGNTPDILRTVMDQLGWSPQATNTGEHKRLSKRRSSLSDTARQKPLSRLDRVSPRKGTKFSFALSAMLQNKDDTSEPQPHVPVDVVVNSSQGTHWENSVDDCDAVDVYINQAKAAAAAAKRDIVDRSIARTRALATSDECSDKEQSVDEKSPVCLASIPNTPLSCMTDSERSGINAYKPFQARPLPSYLKSAPKITKPKPLYDPMMYNVQVKPTKLPRFLKPKKKRAGKRKKHSSNTSLATSVISTDG